MNSAIPQIPQSEREIIEELESNGIILFYLTF